LPRVARQVRLLTDSRSLYEQVLLAERTPVKDGEMPRESTMRFCIWQEDA
jgi:hypothetical protein